MAQGIKRRKSWVVSSVLAGVVLLGGGASLTSCSFAVEDSNSSGGGSQSPSDSVKPTKSKPAVPEPVAVVTPEPDAVEVNPGTAPVITVQDGKAVICL